MTAGGADTRVRMRITIRGKVIAVFLRTAPGEWEESMEPSKAQRRFLELREQELQELPREERIARERGEPAHRRGSHLIQYVGKTQWGYWHPDWAFDQDPKELPGYRSMYDFGHGLRLEPAKLAQYLDDILAAGCTKVEHHVLQAIATRRP